MPDDSSPTRDQIRTEIFTRPVPTDQKVQAWRHAEVIGHVPDDEWQAQHAGTCGLCGAGQARLFPGGWRCVLHVPGSARA